MAIERLERVRSTRREDALRRGINPRDVDVLLTDSLGKALSFLVGHGEELVDTDALDALLERRYRGEPLQYIRGRSEFFSREFLVDDRVLIPRPETELLVEAVVARAPQRGRVIDIGTGSGSIAISIALERPDLALFSVDLALGALAVAKTNRELNRARVGLAASDALGAVRGRFDIIVSNPPYIPESEYAGLQTEVRDHEPRGALTPGPRGTEVIERILDQAPSVLSPGGLVLLEIGYGQSEVVRTLAEARRFAVEAVIPDLAAIPRIVVLSAHGQR